MKSCLKCVRYIACMDEDKGPNYSCKKFQKITLAKLDDSFHAEFDLGGDFSEVNDQETQIEDINRSYGEDFDILSLMESATDPLTGKLRDLKIDDRDFKLADNYFDFSINMCKARPPFARQMWISYKLLGEWCPRCSNPKWEKIKNVPVDFPTKNIPEHVQFLSHGVCPKCGITKRQLIKNGLIKPFQQGILCLGQRCVTKDTLILSERGLKYIDEFSKDRSRGFSKLQVKLHNGTNLETTSNFYIAPKLEQVYRLRLKDGGELKGTKDHPILTQSGFKRLENLEKEDYVAIAVDTNCWGTEIPLWNTAYKVAFTKSTKRVPVKLHTEVEESWYTWLGLWVAEGRGTVVTNHDFEVNQFLYNEAVRVLSSNFVKNRSNKAIYLRYNESVNFLKFFLQEDLFSGSAAKHIPPKVLSAPKSYVCAFLRGLFEGDGGLEGPIVSYTTISRRLAHEIRAVLLNLGIAPKLRIKRAWAKNGSSNQVEKCAYTLYISGADLVVFEKEIGFISNRKIQGLRELVKDFHERKVQMSFMRDKLPHTVKYDLLTLIDNLVESLSEFCLPLELNVKPNPKKKSKVTFGRLTLLHRFPYYWKEKDHIKYATCLGLYDIINRLKENNVPLTKSKLSSILQQLRLFENFFPEHLKIQLNYFETYLNSKQIWVKVESIKRSINKHQTYDFTLPVTHRFVGNGIVNHNSGKSTMISSLGAYQTHRFLKIPKLSQLTNTIQSFSPITATYVALNFGKAKTLLYDPWKNFVSETDWFQEYFKMLDHYGRQYGKELYKVLNEFAVFNHKNIRLYPSSPNKDTLRGDTRLMAGIDELGLFPLAQSKDEEEEDGERKLANADETHKSLLNSLVTVQTAMYNLLMKQNMNHLPFAMMFNISSPKHEKDKMMRLLAEAKNSTTMFGVNLATWKVHPGLPKSTPMIQDLYKADPVRAERDFGARPPATTSSYLTSSLLKNDVFVGSKNSHRIDYDNTSEFTKARATLIRAVPFPSVVAIDAGLVNNSFAIGSGYYDFKEGKIVISTLIEAIPLPKRPIDFNYMYRNVIVPVVNDTNGILLTADRWNSIDLLHRIVEDVPSGWEIKSKQYTLKRKDFTNQLSMFQNKNIILPPTERPMDSIPSVDNYRELKNEPISHYYLQCLTVRDEGNTLTKGENYTDDLFRVVTLIVTALTNERVLDRLRKTKIATNNSRNPRPVYFSRSGATQLNVDPTKLVVVSRMGGIRN